MMSFSPEDEKRLEELAREKKKLIQDYHEYTIDQSRYLESEEEELLNKSLEARQYIIESTSAIQEEYVILLEHFNQSPSKGNSALDKLLPSIDSEIALLLKKCKALDNKNAKRAQEQMAELGDKAKSITQGRKTIGAYKQGGYDTSGYFDKKQ